MPAAEGARRRRTPVAPPAPRRPACLFALLAPDGFAYAIGETVRGEGLTTHAVRTDQIRHDQTRQAAGRVGGWRRSGDGAGDDLAWAAGAAAMRAGAAVALAALVLATAAGWALGEQDPPAPSPTQEPATPAPAGAPPTLHHLGLPRMSVATRPVELTYLGVTFRIPRNYLDFYLPGDNEGFVLGVLVDGLQPKTPENMRIFTTRGLYETLQIAIDSQADRTGERAVEISVSIRTESRNIPTIDAAQIYGLEVKEARACTDVERYGRGTGCDFRDDKLIPTAFDWPLTGSGAIFCQSRIDKLMTRGMNRPDNQRCIDFFRYRQFLVEIYYNKQHLPNWLAIRNQAVSLLESFVVADEVPPTADPSTSPKTGEKP